MATSFGEAPSQGEESSVLFLILSLAFCSSTGFFFLSIKIVRASQLPSLPMATVFVFSKDLREVYDSWE